MITYVFGILAFVFAIPTWGMTLVVFFWLKKKIDNFTTLQIMEMAKLSAEGGGFKTLHKVNNSAINNVYTTFGSNIYGYTLEQYHMANRAGILRTDFHIDNDVIFPSVLHNDIGEIYLYISQIEGNKINIFATKPVV